MGRYNEIKLRSKDLRYVEDPSNHVKTHNAPLSDTPHEQRTCREPCRSKKNQRS